MYFKMIDTFALDPQVNRAYVSVRNPFEFHTTLKIIKKWKHFKL